jgi:hypothetical protein
VTPRLSLTAIDDAAFSLGAYKTGGFVMAIQTGNGFRSECFVHAQNLPPPPGGGPSLGRAQLRNRSCGRFATDNKVIGLSKGVLTLNKLHCCN